MDIEWETEMAFAHCQGIELAVCEVCGSVHGPRVKNESTGFRWVCCSHLPKVGQRRRDV